MKTPHILITNDDSIHAPGIRHLWQALKGYARISIVAPATEQSGVGLATTIRTPLQIASIPWDNETQAYSVTGTPADCIKMALSVILDSPPDMIVSGINRGTNHGRTLLYSGTVGGVIEGIFRGIPGIAFSSFDYYVPEYGCFEPYIPKIVEYTMNHPLPQGTLLNVTFPSREKMPDKESYELKLTRQGRQYWLEDPRTNHHEGEGYLFHGWLPDFDESEESDTFWLTQGYITATPIHVDDMTDREYFKTRKEHIEAAFIQ